MMNDKTRERIRRLISQAKRRMFIFTDLKVEGEWLLEQFADCEETRAILKEHINKFHNLIELEEQEIKDLTIELETGKCREFECVFSIRNDKTNKYECEICGNEGKEIDWASVEQDAIEERKQE